MFVDTNIFVAALNEKDSDHKRAKVLLETAFGRLHQLYTSDYILDECFSLAWSATRKQPKRSRLSLIRRLDDTIQESEKLRLLKVNEGDFATAKSYLRTNPGIIPTLTDWTSLVLMKENRVSRILSLDKHFNGVRKIQDFRDVLLVNEVSKIHAVDGGSTRITPSSG